MRISLWWSMKTKIALVNFIPEGTQLTCSVCNTKICKMHFLDSYLPVQHTSYFNWENDQSKIEILEKGKSKKCKCGGYYIVTQEDLLYYFHTKEGWILKKKHVLHELYH
jgi:hypothetical protein